MYVFHQISPAQISFPWISFVQNKFSVSFQQRNWVWQQTELHPNRYVHLRENGHQTFWFLRQLTLKICWILNWLWHCWRYLLQRLLHQGHSNWHQNVKFSGLYHNIQFERNCSVNVWKQANAKKFFFKQNQTSGVLSTECQNGQENSQ